MAFGSPPGPLAHRTKANGLPSRDYPLPLAPLTLLDELLYREFKMTLEFAGVLARMAKMPLELRGVLSRMAQVFLDALGCLSHGSPFG
jgi:hypothetical protein